MSQRCVYGQCKAWAIKGGTVCNKHGGARPDVRANADVRAIVLGWKLGDTLDDPGQTLLKLITQSRRKADALADRLEQLVNDEGDILKALVGESWTVDGNGSAVQVGEYTRRLAVEEREERLLLANFCKAAVAAGLAERVVRVAERQAEIAHQALVAGLDAAGINGEQRQAVLSGAARHLRAVAS